MKTGLTLAGMLAIFALAARADTFGLPGNEFTIDFVNVGNAGNSDDAGAGGGLYFSSYGGVRYPYRIGVYEVPQSAIDKAAASGMTNVVSDAWIGNQPAGNIRWYDAAAFVNWLNVSTGHPPAYKMTFLGSWSMELWSPAESWDNDPGPGVELNRYRHKDAWYFIPSEDEWYKAAFHKNDGVTANYWDYATASNEIPDGMDFSGDPQYDAIFEQGFIQWIPFGITHVGVASAYGTFGQNGHLWEWFESAFDGSNDDPSEVRGVRGGDLDSSEYFQRSDLRRADPPGGSYAHIGLRIASLAKDTDGDGVPDPYETGTGAFISPNNTGTSPADPDTDDDGYLDGFEIAARFDPNSAASTPDGLWSVRLNVHAELEYRFNAAKGFPYRIQSSTDLRSWMTIELGIPGKGREIIRYYPIEGQERRFFRSRRN